MMNVYFAIAAALSLLTAAVHFFVGGIYVARPLLASRELPRVSRCLNYYCWHITSILLVAQGGAYLWAAREPDGIELAVLFTSLDAVYAVLCVWVALREKIAPWRLPAMSLFTTTSIISLAGLV